MLPRKSGLLLLLTAMSAGSAGFLGHAQQAQASATVSSHFGDDPDGKLGWANPNFDDSAWPVAKDGQWPLPAFYSDGFVWVRMRVPVGAELVGTLAIQIGASQAWLADEVFVNGELVGRVGRVPPDDQ